MIFVDGLIEYRVRDPRVRRVGTLWCHMWDAEHNVPRLIAFALQIGLKESWFQDRPNFPHFDLTPSRRARAIKAGAVETDLRDFLRSCSKTTL